MKKTKIAAGEVINLRLCFCISKDVDLDLKRFQDDLTEIVKESLEDCANEGNN